jgi:hypothetical protein
MASSKKERSDLSEMSIRKGNVAGNILKTEHGTVSLFVRTFSDNISVHLANEKHKDSF